MLASLSFESVSKVAEAKLFQRNFGKKHQPGARKAPFDAILENINQMF